MDSVSGSQQGYTITELVQKLSQTTPLNDQSSIFSKYVKYVIRTEIRILLYLGGTIDCWLTNSVQVVESLERCGGNLLHTVIFVDFLAHK